METRSERRYRKLIGLCEKHGGYACVAAAAGLNPASLDQIIKKVLLPPKKDGSQSPRSLGDPAAHAIEDAFNLGRGWFDTDDQAAQVEVKMSVAEPPPSYFADDPLVVDHQMVFGLLTDEDRQEVHALACAMVLEKNPQLRALMERAGVSRRADDAKVTAWKARIDNGSYAIKTHIPRSAPKPAQPHGTTKKAKP